MRAALPLAVPRSPYTYPDVVVGLSSIDCKLPLVEVFERIEFETAAEATNTPPGIIPE